MTAAAPVPLLRDGRYVRVWLVGWFTGIVRWLDLLAYGIFAFEITGSPLLVALLALVRFLPLALFSLPFGAAGDSLSPRRLVFWSATGVMAATAALLAVQLTAGLAYWHLVLGTLASGIYWASDMPLRRKMVGEIAGPDRLARAMSYDYATSNGTRLFGPLIGGVIYQGVGMAGVLGIGLVLYAISAWLAAGIAPTGGQRGGRFRPVHVVIGALRAARRALRSNDVGCILAVTVVFNLFGFPFVSMIPVIGEATLGLPPSAIGYVSAIEGAFSLISLALIVVFVRAGYFRRLYFGGLAVHLIAVAFIGLVPGLWALCLGLAVAGFATSGFAVMQATLIYAVAPKGMRGRYLGLMSICIGAGVIGFANVGWMAELFGAQTALVIMAGEGAVAATVLATSWRALWTEAGAGRRPVVRALVWPRS